MTLSAHALPLLYVVMLWFMSTALVVALDHRARAQTVLTYAGGAACAALAVIGMLAASRDALPLMRRSPPRSSSGAGMN
jgi:hypothetical protein